MQEVYAQSGSGCDIGELFTGCCQFGIVGFWSFKAIMNNHPLVLRSLESSTSAASTIFLPARLNLFNQ